MFMSGGDQMLRYAARAAPLMDRRWKPNHMELAPSCPRCASPNTKFCYYNNYSLSQPRYFCKACRRYWTKGGSLRNVPIGGGCRKTRRTTRSPTPGSSSCHHDPSESESGSGHGSSANSDPPAGESAGARPGCPPSEINLAVVFARFLNQNSEVDPETPEVESAASTVTTHSESLDYAAAAESLGPGGQQQQEQEEDRVMGDLCEGFVGGRATEELMGDGPNSDEFGLPNLVLGGEVDAVHDPEIAWATSDHLSYGECSLPNFAWQDFELLQLPPDDPLKISTICDNWSVFDLSGL